MSPRDIPQLRPFFLLFLLSLLSSRNRAQLTSETSNLVVPVVCHLVTSSRCVPFFMLFLLSLLSSRNKEQLTSDNSNLVVPVVVKNTPALMIFDDNIDNGDNLWCG